MNPIREKLFLILGYAMDALRYEEKGDKHYLVSLSLLKYNTDDLLQILEKEEE
tara:strand:- start:556 stop:714 length:159 start_codon:yes stop_codon:yes gene_type:complete